MPRLCERIGVIGNGFVGRAIARGFMEHCGEVRVHDVLPERSTHTLAEALDCGWTFVCVPTPAREDGRCDVDAVVEVIERSASMASQDLMRTPRLIIKSTVPLGFTRISQQKFPVLTILHSPEFLTQRCALVDFQTPARNIVGSPNWPGDSEGGGMLACQRKLNLASAALCHLYQQRFPGVPCLQMSSDESELVKLAQNGFFATKVAYFNAIYQLAKATGCDFEAVRAGMLADGRIAHAHTEVPGPSGEFGFGGACLDKDLRSLRHCMDDHQVNGMDWLEFMQGFNSLIRGG